MKKYYIIFAAALLVAVSCTQNEIAPAEAAEEPAVEITDDSEPRGLTFTATWEKPATVNAAAGTKTTLGDNGLDVKWMANDAVSLFDGDGAAYAPSSGTFAEGFVKDTRYSAYNVSADGKTASFKVSDDYTPAAEGKSIYWAFTPRIQDAAVNFADGKLIAWLTRYQRGNAGNFSEHRGTVGRYLNFAVGSTTDPENEPIVFKNILCHLKFTVPASMEGKITRIGVHTGSGEYLSGDQYVDLTGAAPATSLRYNVGEYKSGSRYGDMYLFPDHGTGNNANITGGQTFAAGSYYMAIMPCELKAGLFVTFDTVEGNTYYIDHYAVSTTFVRNKVYDMGELSWNNPASTAGTAVTLPYALSFLQAKEQNGDMEYSTNGTIVAGTSQTGFGDISFIMGSGTLATDKTYNVTLTAQTTVGISSKNTANNAAYKTFWCNNGGHDPILTGSMSNRTAFADLPFENYFKVAIPLGEDLPATFKVSAGLISRSASWGLRDWKLYYSNDNKVWCAAPETANLADLQTRSGSINGSLYPFVTFTITPEYTFHNGDMLYIKFMPYGNTVMKGSTADGLPGSTIAHNSTGTFGIHSCVVVYDPEVAASATPAGSIFYEGFNSVSGGVDYFLGGGARKRLAGIANLCGDALSLSGYTVSNCYARPGYAQIGYLKTNGGTVDDNATGSLTTPAIGQAGDLTLTFKAAIYENPACDRTGSSSKAVDNATPDVTSITVTVLNGGTIDGDTTVQIDDVDTEAWQTITKTIVGATAATQIQFSSPATGTYHRWFLDDITVK